MNVTCPCTRAAYIALTALIGFGFVLLIQFGAGTSTAGSDAKPALASLADGPAPGPLAAKDAPMRVVAIVPVKSAGSARNYINFALASNGATAVGGQNAKLLLDGNDADYTGSTGFAMTQWNNNPPQYFVVTLKESTLLACVRFLLWDRSDERFYRYKLDISPSETGEDWKTVADRSDPAAECKSWQVITFPSQSVRRMRLTGTYNSANAGFHVVELQAYVDTPPTKETEPERMDF